MINLKIIIVCALHLLFCNSYPKHKVKHNFMTKSCTIKNEEGKKNLNNYITNMNSEMNDLRRKNNIRIIEGDIIMTKEQLEYYYYYTSNETVYRETKNSYFPEEIKIRTKRKVKKDLKYKWKFPIPYFVKKGVSEYLIEKAIYFIEKETCVLFERRYETKPNVSGIFFQYGLGCKSYIGKQPGNIWQEVVLGEGCSDVGRVQHEILHALGFIHEQSRIDRDSYIDVLIKNVDPKEKSNFFKVKKDEIDLMGLSYDYGSIMHYGIYSFSKNKKPTMLPKDNLYNKTLGHSDKASFIDYKMINLYYCSKSCKSKIECKNGGYQDPKNCRTCKCVEGFAGVDCSKIAMPEITCRNPLIKVDQTTGKLREKGVKNCIYHFFAPKGMKVAIKILSGILYPNKKLECLALNALEVKYWTDKTVSGARLCLKLSNILLKSHNNHVILYYRSSNRFNEFSLLYKAVNVTKKCDEKKKKNEKKKKKNKKTKSAIKKT